MSTEVTRNPDKQRYEIHVDGVLAGFTQAIDRDDEVTVFPHTVVFDEFEGRGLASALVTGALDDIRTRGRRIVAECPYVARFVEKHPDYADLLV